MHSHLHVDGTYTLTHKYVQWTDSQPQLKDSRLKAKTTHSEHITDFKYLCLSISV